MINAVHHIYSGDRWTVSAVLYMLWRLAYGKRRTLPVSSSRTLGSRFKVHTDQAPLSSFYRVESRKNGPRRQYVVRRPSFRLYVFLFEIASPLGNHFIFVFSPLSLEASLCCVFSLSVFPPLFRSICQQCLRWWPRTSPPGQTTRSLARRLSEKIQRKTANGTARSRCSGVCLPLLAASVICIDEYFP